MRDKRGKSEGGAEGELLQATGDNSPSGPVLPTRPRWLAGPVHDRAAAPLAGISEEPREAT